MGDLVVRNAQVLDPETGSYLECDVRAESGRVVEMGDKLDVPSDVPSIDAGGAHVLPGLIDSHVHVAIPTADTVGLYYWPRTYVALRAAQIMSQMLDRGFTTVRDVAGADRGLAQAQQEGLIRGPRLAYGGKGLAVSGGHGDHRNPGGWGAEDHRWSSGASRVVQGVENLRAAVRDELRQGAHHVKVMVSGGIASPGDRIDSVHFSMDELRAVVDEAELGNRYVAAHAYTARSANRALEAGIRSIEHGNLIGEETIALLLEKEAFLVPNIVTYWALKNEGREDGLPEAAWQKVDDVLNGALESLELASRRGVQIAFGTDLLGEMHRHQSHEFKIRAEVQQPLEIIRAATTTGARLLNLEGRIGVIAPGAHADMIVLDRDPLEDINALAEPQHITHIIQNGSLVTQR